ncbi:MAG: S1 RNA-binding domain-containing protein [Candidatus Shikimatogenerans sp. Tduv]|uniref:S1 RNA-binding domain-containing protein n=1 Tax=Candidatus Shikimatogenerans sp. Tduv TaxID=3158567 RepID=A0AAU7QQS2_9FLAO
MFNNFVLKDIFFKKYNVFLWEKFKNNITLKEKIFILNKINKKIIVLKKFHIYKAIILKKIKDYIIIYINNNKCENFLPIKELKKKKIKIGSIIKVMVMQIDSINGNIVSYYEALKLDIWKKVISYYKNNDFFSVKIYKKVYGGYMIKIENILLGFLPKCFFIKKYKYKINEIIKVKIININFKKFNIIVSNNYYYKYISFKKNILKNKILKKKYIIGKIKKILNNNVIIKLNNNLKGYLYKKDIIWEKKKDILKKINLNKKYKFKILKVNFKKRNIQLGLKQLNINSWINLIKFKLKIGTIIKCVIYKITKFFIKVKIFNYYVKGIIPINELYWNMIFNNYKKDIKIGKKLRCLIIDVNYYERKIILSHKRLLKDNFKNYFLFKKFKIDFIYKGIIKHIDIINNVYLLLTKNIECILYNNDFITNNLHLKMNLKKFFKVNQIIYISLIYIDFFKKFLVGKYENIYNSIMLRYNFIEGDLNLAKVIFIDKKYYHLIYKNIIGVKILLNKKKCKKIKNNTLILVRNIFYNKNIYILYVTYIRNL